MARKRRTNKATAKRNIRKKSDSDQNSNSISDENEVESKQSTNNEDNQNPSQSSSTEKNHKHVGKFRYLERRHSSSQDEDCEYNTSDLMPQQIQDIVLGDVKAVISVNQDDGSDTCLRGVIEQEIVLQAMEFDTSDYGECDVVETVGSNQRTDFAEPSSPINQTTLENTELIETFEKTVQINENVNISLPNSKEENCLGVKIPVHEECNVITSDSTTEPVNNEKLLSSVIISKEIAEEPKKIEESAKKNQIEEPRRRSSRIRVNRWTDDEVKTPAPQEVQVAPPPPPSNIFDSDKPVKVKSRWRRTSELEMGGTSGSVTSDSDISTVTTLSLTSPEVPPSVDPDVEEGLKSFEIITHNIFITTRVKSKEKEIKKMVCDCTLSKEEMAKGEMGCGEDCLNRLLMIECGVRCLLGNYCSNRRFQNCEYTPCQVIKTKKKGLGLITTVSVGAGAFLMEYVGEVLDSKEFRRRAKEYSKGKSPHFYFMYLKGHTIIDATVKGNISRFINHSCDPNSETQKWTVNGELRIGFFSKRPIAAGEEITFDYKLDRYGKEAQKCFCESPNCRGWIGENPDAVEKDKEKKESSSRKEKKEKKRKEEKRRDFMSDRELEEEIDKLVSTGVKNQNHTLTLSRLMVRAEEDSSRKQLLEIAQSADIRCLRLFLDYHGLSLLWYWMLDSRSSPELRMEILNTLAILPIPNRTVLQDSKVLNVVQKWAKMNDDSSDTKDRSMETENGEDSSPGDSGDKVESLDKINDIKDEEMEKNIVTKACELFNTWLNLKQEFRIPKKERIEQMKEHEREADRGYYSDPRENQSYDRHWNYEKENRNYDKEFSRYGSSNNHRERKRGRESPSDPGIGDWRKSRMQQDERHNGAINRLSKTERRQLFAMKVEEEDRQRKMEEWAKQQQHAQMLGPPAPTPPQMDPNQGYYQQPPFHPPPDAGEMVFGGCPPAFPPPFMGPPQPPPPYMDGPPPSFSNPPPPGPPPGGFHPPYSHPPIAPPYQPPLPSYPPFPYNPPPPQAYPPSPALPAPSGPAPPVPLTTPPPSVTLTSAPPPAVPLTSAPPPMPLVSAPPPVLSNPPMASAPPPAVTLPSTPPTAVSLATAAPPAPALSNRVFPIKLPPKWRSAKDNEGRIYYYHTKTRKSQWQIPAEDSASQLSDSDSESDESTDDEDSSSEDEEEEKEEEEDEYGLEEEENIKRDDDDEEYTPEDMRLEDIPAPAFVPTPPALKKRREGLVQVNIISPRDEDDDYRCGIKKKQIRETKEKLAKEKKKLRSGGAAKCEADTSVGPRRRIKDLFRMQMADVVVSLLNPYRKSDCKIARITNTDDFKHLARKLTHFVMVKELKHCASVEELECNENVKHKAKDFIRKYMSKFGPIYKRSPDE